MLDSPYARSVMPAVGDGSKTARPRRMAVERVRRCPSCAFRRLNAPRVSRLCRRWRRVEGIPSDPRAIRSLYNVRMRSTATLVVGACLACGLTAVGQPQPPAADTVAGGIPGVVTAGTSVQVIKDGFTGTEGPITLPDGSLIFTETNANRITRIDKDGHTSTFLENTNGANGLAFDTKGRLIAVQTTPGNTKVGVITRRAKRSCRQLRRQPFGRERSRRRQEGRRVFHRPGRTPRSQSRPGRSRRRRRPHRCPPRSTTFLQAARPSGLPTASNVPTEFSSARTSRRCT